MKRRRRAAHLGASAAIVALWLSARLDCAPPCALAAAPAARALAGEPPSKLALLAGTSRGGPVAAAELYAELRRALALYPGIELLPFTDELAAEEDRPAIEACGAELTCVASRAASLGAALGLAIAVNADLDPPLASVRLVTAGAAEPGRSLGERVLELPRGSSPIRALSAVCLELLEAAGLAPGGQLVAAVHPPGARIAIGGAPIEPVTTLPPGRYEVAATHDGYLEARATVVILAGARTEVALSLEPEPGLLASPWVWAAIGVALAGATVAIVAAAPFESREIACLCVATPGADCRCDQQY